MDKCVKKYGGVRDVKQTVGDIEQFCRSLRANKVKESQERFIKLPQMVQCLFLHYGWAVLNKQPSEVPDDAYLTAFRLFKLFRNKDMKNRAIYSDYNSLAVLDKYYKRALEWNRGQSSSKSPGVRSARGTKKYDKEHQRYEAPSSELDPLYVYYTSLYSQQSKSPLAITWLTEHGVFDGEKREKLVKKYKELLEKNKLIR